MSTRIYRGLWCLVGLALGACSSSPDNSTPSATTAVPITPSAGTAPGAGTAAPSAGTTGVPSGAIAGRASGATAGTAPAAAGTTAAPTSGTGATTTAGTSAATAGTAAAAGTSATPTTSNGKPDAGEFFVSGNWHGYVFAKAVGMGSTVTPLDFKMQTTGMPRCIKGSVAAAADYSGVALLGFGLNEDGGTKMSVTPTKAGVNVVVTNPGMSKLRFQVEGPAGTEDQRWCTELSGTGGFIPWSNLKTKCWGADGIAYKNEPIVSAMLLVPGDATAAVAYDFCVTTLAEADGSAGAAAGSGAAGTSAGGAGGMSGGGSQSSGGSSSVPPGGSGGGCKGYATGYWDCCKPHCGWKDNASGANPLMACDKSDNSLGADYDAKSACDGGGNAYQCHNLAPWAVNDKLAYGYAAVPAAAQKNNICGRCYQLSFSGQSNNSEPDPGSTALAGKTMIVQAINIGHDVQGGQFDLLVPGRGVGAFDACSSQWGVNKADLGEQYGGFLLKCQKNGDRKNHAAMKSCVMQSCMNVFEAKGLSELAAGCKWFIDWFQIADNPQLEYKEVACPAELNGKGIMRNAQPANMCLQ